MSLAYSRVTKCANIKTMSEDTMFIQFKTRSEFTGNYRCYSEFTCACPHTYSLQVRKVKDGCVSRLRISVTGAYKIYSSIAGVFSCGVCRVHDIIQQLQASTGVYRRCAAVCSRCRCVLYLSRCLSQVRGSVLALSRLVLLLPLDLFLHFLFTFF